MSNHMRDPVSTGNIPNANGNKSSAPPAPWDRAPASGEDFPYSPNGNGGVRRAGLTVESWEQFRDRADDAIPYLIDGLWAEGSFGFTAAPPKKGKTWVCISKALALATGTPFLDVYDVPKACPVIYVALEGHRTALTHRISAIARGIGVDPAGPIENLHLVYKPAGIDITDPWWAEQMQERAADTEARLIIVDVLRAAARMKESDADSIAALRANLAGVLDAGCSIDLAHHFTKLSDTSKERDPLERMSGSGAMGGQADVAILITGSSHGARKLRIEYATRDGAEPKPVGVFLEGNGTGLHGAFTGSDTAWWRPSELPTADDVNAPATEIAKWIKTQDGDVATKAITDHFEISTDTLSRRQGQLAEHGITWRKIGTSNYYLGTPDTGQGQL